MVSFKKRCWLLLGTMLFASALTFAQELSCRVDINTQQIPGTDKAIFERFRRTVETYLNTTRFTDLNPTTTERIDCSMLFTFKKRNGNQLSSDLTIQSSRPVYGSVYSTTLLYFREECQFEFQESTTLSFQRNTAGDNLTATLNYWAFTIIGLDFDSFSKLGGTPYFQTAQEIANMARGVLGDNWKAQEDKNHWGWSNVLNNENQTDMRKLSYEYHRQGLDSMYLKPERGRANILESLSYLSAAKKARPSSPLLANFLDTKADELINVFSKATQEEKDKTYDLLKTTFPAATTKLQRLKNPQ